MHFEERDQHESMLTRSVGAMRSFRLFWVDQVKLAETVVYWSSRESLSMSTIGGGPDVIDLSLL